MRWVTTRCQRSSAALALAATLAQIAACGLVVSGDELGDGTDVDADLAEYEALVRELGDDREQALDEDARAVTTAGAWLAWVDGEQLGLRRYPDRLELSVPAGDAYRLHPRAVVTTAALGGALVLRSYALPDATWIAEQTLPPPGASSLGLALTDSDDPVAGALAVEAWIVHDGQVSRWALDAEPPVVLGQLGDAGVEGGQVRAVELGLVDDLRVLFIHVDERLWRLDPSAWAAEEIAELDQLAGVSPRGLLYTRGPALYLRDHAGSTLRVDAAIAATGYALNPTFARIHEYTGEGASLVDDRVLYTGSAGLFLFDLDEVGPGAVTPVLLEPRWDVSAGIPRIEYREPRATPHMAFARGLVGESGEVGTAGPIFAAPLP